MYMEIFGHNGRTSIDESRESGMTPDARADSRGISVIRSGADAPTQSQAGLATPYNASSCGHTVALGIIQQSLVELRKVVKTCMTPTTVGKLVMYGCS